MVLNPNTLCLSIRLFSSFKHIQGGFSIKRDFPDFITSDAISKCDAGVADTNTPATVSSLRISFIDVVPIMPLNFFPISSAFFVEEQHTYFTLTCRNWMTGKRLWMVWFPKPIKGGKTDGWERGRDRKGLTSF